MPTLTLDEFLPKARELNPDYSDDELIQAYQDRYSTPPTQTVSSAPLMTLDEFLPKARKLNPDYSDDELTAAWQEKYGARGAKEKDPGFSGTLLEGAKSAGRSLKAAAQTATGNLSGVEETARVETEKDPALQKLLADIQVRKNALGKDPSWWQSAKAVGGAVVDNPKGAAMLATEQLPNSALALGSAGVGALAGSALGPAGTVIGGIAGLFVGNTAIETGAKAMEKAVDGFTPEERTETLKEGAIKGGVVTGFDAATFGLTKWLTGTVARAMERATINVLQREGIDTTNKAAVQAARQNPEIVAKVQQAQDTARAATNTLGKKLARGSGEVGSEAIGEGAGEYIGEVAATGKGDKVEAVIEALSGLGQSGAEIAIAQGMSRKQRQQGAFGDVTGQPVVTERTPDEMGMGQTAASPQPASPSPATSTPIQASAQPDLFSQPAQSGMSEPPGVPPLPNIRPVTDAKTLDEAIAGSQQIVKDATDKAKAQAIPDTSTQSITPNVINIGRMGEAISGNLYEALWKKVQAGDTKENGQESVYLQAAKPVYQAGGLKDVHDLKAFSHEISNIEDSGIRGNERNTAIRSVIQRWAQKEQLRLAQQNPVSEPVQPVPAVQPTDEGPLPSQADLAYPSSKQVRDLIHEKGLHLDTPVFREYLKQAVGKEKFADLTPQELQTLAEKVQKIKAPQQPTPIQEAPPQVPLTPAERPEKPYAPTTTIPEAQVPRSELTPEKNAEILLRAERPQGVTQATENAEVFQNVPKKRGANENLREVPTESGQADQENPRLVLPAMPRKGDSGVQENPQADTRTANEIKRQELRARLQEQGENNQKAVPEVRIGEGRNAPRGLQQANASGVDVQAVPPGDAQPSKVVKVPTSRTERLKQQKQKMEGKRPLNALELVDRMYREVMDNTKVVHSMQRERKDQWATVKRIDAAMNNSLREGLDYGEAAARVSPEDLQALSALLSPVAQPEPSPSEAPRVEPQSATASPERAPAPPIQEAAPTNSESRATVSPMATDRGPGSSETAQQPPEPGRDTPQSKEFTQWFGRSKVVNEDGSPKKLFHGTNAQFKEFSEKNIIAQGGFWFAEKESFAKKFGNRVSSYYLRIENPLDLSAAEDSYSLGQWREIFSDLGVREVTFDSALSDFDEVQYTFPELLPNKGNDLAGDGNLTEKIRSSGFDGIHAPDEVKAASGHVASGGSVWVAFSTDQIRPLPNPSSLQQGGLTPSAPTEATFSLTAPEQTKVKAKETGPEQLSIDVPPPTVGEKPIIGREATLEEAPLFSKNAQTPDAEQTTLDTPTAQKEPWEMTRREFVDAVRGGLDFPQLGMSPTPLRVMREAGSFENLDRQAKERHIAEVAEAFYEGKPVPSKVLADYPDLQAKEAESQPETAQSPTDILAAALRQAADQIQGKPAAPSAIDTIEAYEAFSKRLRNGEVTLDEYKQAFQQVKDNKEALVGELKKLTKDQLVKRSRSLRSSKNDSKDELVRQSYDGMLSTFSTGRGVSYVLSGKGGYEQALAKMVEDTTEADLKKYADDIAETTAEYKKRLEGFENPQTLQNFDDRVRVKGEASLTPEQLARYDELLAEAGRAKRKQAQEQKATVQGVEAGTDLQMVESKHTKTGDKLWVVKLANRVDRSVYDRLNQAAHKLGGRYSSYNKDGAIPGFTFRSEEAAKAFMAAGKGETVSAAPVREAAKATVQNNAVSKLREMADNLQEKADESLNADRKTNTAKRARQASSAENDALASKALAETMRNLADAIESGEATHLSGLRTKAQVEMLDSMLERAKHDRIKQETKGSYVDYERQKHRKAEPEDAAFAKLPDFNTTDDQLTHVVKDLADVKGTERIRMKVSKLIERAKGSNFVPVDRELVEAALEKYPQFRRGVTPPWHWPETLAKLKRLESMGITSLPELRAALREFVEYRGKRGTIDKAKQLERELIGNKGIGNDFFPTPKETAQRMVAEAGIEPGMTVLEPSAGNGNIAEAIRAAGVNPDVVEQSSKLREILEAKGFNLAGRDFMDVTDGQYDRIVMNPPFSNGQDAEHIRHAYELLKPGGKLVAIAGEGIFFRNDAKATAFREWLDEHGGTSEKLPEGTFKDSSLMATTGVNARMVIVEKPGESAPEETQPEAVGSAFSRLMADERGSIPASLFGRDKNATGTIDPPIARERLKESKASLRPYLLGALGLEQLSQVYGKDHAEVKAYNKATQDMEADFTEMSRESDVVARAWTDLKIPVADKMAQVMEDARFLNFDPDPRKKQEADSVKKQELVTRFDQLPEEAKAVYRQARDFYTGLSKKRFEALRDRILREHGTQKDIDELNVAYTAERRKIYFPFTRFGDYIVKALKVENGVTKDRDVQAFESPAEANKFAQLMKLKGWTVKQTVASEYSREHDGGASQVVDKMKEIIERLDKSPGLPGISSKDTLLDALNQSYLQSMPDLSYSKHYIHARDVKGASRDALRAFAHSALHGSHHISRLRHADKVTKSLFEMDERIKEAREGDVQEARQVYNELVRRHNDIMNPNTHPVSAWLGQLGFTMSLGGVVATGITNATQVPLVTYPWLGARYGFGKASAALARAYKDFLNPRTLNKDSLFDASKSKLISESERKMLMELARRGRIDLTQTMDLAGLSAQDNLSRKAKLTGTLNEKVTRMLGFTFHAPEVMNRQVTALSTFRLEKEKGGSFDEALQRAEQAIIDTHFLYQSFNRPRYMSGNFLRVLTQFKQYSQNIAYTYGRAASIWMDRNGATKEERQVAKRQLISMLALQFGAAGALGMPFFGSGVDILMAVVGAFGDDDDKREWEVALRKWLDGTATSLAEAFTDDKEQAAKVGKELAEVVSHGASRLTPWDMAGRLGQNDLFFREPQREREGRQAVMDWMLALGGPVPSYGVNFMLGMGDVAKGITELNAGFFMRGVEELTPAVLRNGVKSLRYTLEGVRTRDEYKQLELDTSEKLGQAFGFTPARVAEMYESTTAVKNKEHRILNEQKSLKNRFARAVDDQDDAAKQRILEDIRGFNERNRMFAITSDTLNRSLKARRQHEAGMERGMYLPPRRRALLEEGDFGDF